MWAVDVPISWAAGSKLAASVDGESTSCCGTTAVEQDVSFFLLMGFMLISIDQLWDVCADDSIWFFRERSSGWLCFPCWRLAGAGRSQDCFFEFWLLFLLSLLLVTVVTKHRPSLFPPFPFWGEERPEFRYKSMTHRHERVSVEFDLMCFHISSSRGSVFG